MLIRIGIGMLIIIIINIITTITNTRGVMGVGTITGRGGTATGCGTIERWGTCWDISDWGSENGGGWDWPRGLLWGLILLLLVMAVAIRLG